MSDDAHLLIGRANGNAYRRINKSESGTEIPPAYMITDSDGAVWVLGTEYNPQRYGYGVLEFNVLRNDVDTREFASRIIYDRGVVKLYGRDGLRVFSRSRKCFI